MRNIKIQNKLLIFILLSSLFIMPITVNAYTDKVILGGDNIGIEVNSKGVLVVGFYDIEGSSPGKEANLKVGDIITKIDETVINNITDLTKVKNNKSLNITYLRNNKEYKTNINLIQDKKGVYKTGIYVKDKIIGIGTLTFIDPETMTFGALGHEIIEKETKKRFEIKDGKIFKSNVTDIIKSEKNKPGEKNATLANKNNKNNIYGQINKNEINGIYGKYQKPIINKETIDVANPEEIILGSATIKTVLKDNEIEEFKINIINKNNNNKTKNLLFEIVDEELLSKTNGIIQGMSGSPIIQNNKIVGAVTHMILDNPKKGFGIYITNMLKEVEN